jgi:Tol biopolymer transport system component
MPGRRILRPRQLIRGVATRFTFPPLQGLTPVWSRDGSRIVSNSGGDLYRKDASGGGQEELLIHKGYFRPSDWSRDGRYLPYTEMDTKTRADLWILPEPMGKSGGSTLTVASAATITMRPFAAPDRQAAFPDGSLAISKYFTLSLS